MNFRMIFRVAVYFGTALLLFLAARIVYDGNGWQSKWGQMFMFYSSLSLALCGGTVWGLVVAHGDKLEAQAAAQIMLILVLIFIANVSALILPPFYSAVVLAAGFIFCFVIQFRTEVTQLLPEWYRKLAIAAIPFAIGANVAMAIDWY